MYNKNVLNEEVSLIRKYTSKVSEYEDGISLAIGEPYIKIDQKIIDATKNSLDKEEYNYTNAQGDNSLINEICIKEKVNKSNVLITQGSSIGIFISLLSILNIDEEVIIITPCYPQYAPVVNFCNGKVIYVDTLNTNLIPTEEEILKKISNKTKAIIINSPSNPTGITYDINTLNMINSIAKKHNIFIITDDVYEHLIYQKKCNFNYDLTNTIILKSFSKTYGMTGYRLGYILSSEETIKQLIKLHSYLMISAPIFTQKAAVEALKISNINYNYFSNNLSILKKFLDDSNIEYIDATGGIFLFINIKKFNLTCVEFCDLLLSKYHVSCVPGICFKASGYIRVNFAIETNKLITAISRINLFINTLKEG